MQKEFNLPGDEVVIKALGFTGAGTAGMGHTCGALLGGILALGLASGREDLEDPAYPNAAAVDESTGLPTTQMIIRRYYEKFIQEFGTWTCRDLQIKMVGRAYDFGVPAEGAKFREAGGRKGCSELVGKAARIAAEAIMALPRR